MERKSPAAQVGFFVLDERTHGWMAPFALVLMAGGLSLFWAAAGAGWRRLRPQGWARVLVFAGARGVRLGDPDTVVRRV